MKQQKFKLIEQYYLKAWKVLLNNDYSQASNILYKEMPTELYDLSMDILFDRNNNENIEELHQLIKKVDGKLVDYSKDDVSYENLEDNIKDF